MPKQRRSTILTLCLLILVLLKVGITSKAVEEFYAALLEEVAQQTTEGHILVEGAVEGYLPTLEQQFEAANHMLENTPEHLIEEANFLIDVANTLNVPTFDNIDFSAYPVLDTAIRLREEALCHPVVCDPNNSWRRVDGRCNNLANPRWGAANEAQNRIIPAEWEKGAILPFTLLPGELADVTKNGVKVADSNHVIFIAVGNIPLILRFNGDVQMIVTLQPNVADAASKIEINGVVMGEFQESLFDRKVKSLLWIKWAQSETGFQISLGRDSECTEENAVIHIAHAPVRFNRLYIEAGEFLGTARKQYIKASFYIRSTYELETSEDDAISLKNVPWLYEQHKSVVFGIKRETGHFNMILKGSNDESQMDSSADLKMGLDDGIRSTLRLCIKGTCDDYSVVHDNMFATMSDVHYFWVSWMGRSINFGSGQVVGKNPYDIYESSGYRWLLSDTFTVTDVLVTSTSVITYIFNLEIINLPRRTSESGPPLPSPRDVSLAVHCKTGETKLSNRLSLMTFQVGQHVDHDVIGTPLQTHNGSSITCAVNNIPLPPDQLNRFCMNIIISKFKNEEGDQGNHPHTTVKALNFVRSAVVIDCDDSLQPRDLRVRNPMNLLTAFVDAGNLYSNSDTDLNELRAMVTGDIAQHTSQYMAVDERNELPTTHENLEAPCNNVAHPSEHCRKTGDFRSNEHSGLNSLHTLWVREHNRVARELTNNHGFPDSTVEERETIFQHTRRIIIAEMQYIVYHGYLKSYMDPIIGDKYGLGIGDPSKKCNYNPNLDPTVFNCFGIAYRMGHSMITEILRDEDPVNGLDKILLVNNFFNPHPSHENMGTDSILKYLAGHACPENDRTLERVATEDLFRINNMSSDLAALNIQRGRDHGCPNYCAFREHYGLYVPKSWNDAVSNHLISEETVTRLKLVYDCVCDMDLFTAVISETALINRPDYDSDSLIGELINHIMSDMFGRLRCGDRFWYEFDDAGFSDFQKEELSKATLSRILCDNVPSITELQPDVFKLPNLADANGVNINEVQDCGSLPRVDLSLFAYTP